jgi:NAD(P)-dependent dehydrogenase (short-subunit alcohol dehydrogenase family)
LFARSTLTNDDLRNKVAVVTGAAGGLGAALATNLARFGCQVALCDVDEAGLERTRAACEGLGARASSRVLDVSEADPVFAWAKEVVAQHGAPHLVFNNAGATLLATVENATLEELRWLMGVNFWGVVHGTKAFLPHMKAAGGGHLVNISSAFGFIGIPGQSAYTASKFAVRGFTEALAIELRIEGSPVLAHVVHPGGIATGIARHARLGENQVAERPREEMLAAFDRIARTSADDAAREIVEGVRRGSRRILIGMDARVISALQRLLPSRYQRLVELGARRRGLTQV